MDQTPDQNPQEEVVTMTIPVDPPVTETPAPQTDSPQSQTESLGQDSVHESPEESKVEPQPTDEVYKPVSGHNSTRPCRYCNEKESILKIANDYYESCKNGNKPAYIQELAVLLDIDRETIWDWVNNPEHPEIADTTKKIKTIQELWLLKRTIGRYNPTGAIFQLKTNHGYMESEKKVLAGDKEEPLQIEFIEEKNPFKNEE